MTSGGKLTFSIVNTGSAERVVHLEPWGEQYVLAEGDVLVLEFVGPPGNGPTMDLGEGEVTVYGWPGVTMSASRIKMAL